ncbi:MAG: winged helix DNA-binding domain-containing protein [Myxococcota bacterium]
MKVSERALNRALLARQGLSTPLTQPVAEVVTAIGAMQAQQWSTIPIALWSRMKSFDAADLHAALDAGDLVVGTSIRRTVHLVSAPEHPAYATVADAMGANEWQRGKTAPSKRAAQLRKKLRTHLAKTKTAAQLVDFIEAWVDANPGVIAEDELTEQRKYKWRPLYTWSALLRAPADDVWSDKTPAAYRAAKVMPGTKAAPTVDDALEQVIRAHLRAFGPAAPDDVAGWIGWKVTPVRAAMEAMADELETFSDGTKRTLYDLADAPRPGPDAPAPPRLLPAFDSTLLAYANKHRGRILPDEYKKAVYSGANLRVKPTVLVDGQVAGIWSTKLQRRVSTLTIEAFDRIPAKVQRKLESVGDQLLRTLEPKSREYEVVFAQS